MKEPMRFDYTVNKDGAYDTEMEASYAFDSEGETWMVCVDHYMNFLTACGYNIPEDVRNEFQS